MRSTLARAVKPAVLAVTAALALGSAGSARAELGYKIDVTTFYQFGNPAGTLGPWTASPDSGFFTITNNGSTTFTGTIGEVAVSQFAGDYSYSIGGLTLAPGASATFSTSPESSNIGGFNGPFGSPQPGITITLSGLLNGTEAFNHSVNDADIHSGVVNGSGLTDAYVLQGGNPTGGDNGDPIETTQAPGHFEFSAPASIPEPSTFAIAGLSALLGLGYVRMKRRSA
jgi:hypothetical protein